MSDLLLVLYICAQRPRIRGGYIITRLIAENGGLIFVNRSPILYRFGMLPARLRHGYPHTSFIPYNLLVSCYWLNFVFRNFVTVFVNPSGRLWCAMPEDPGRNKCCKRTKKLRQKKDAPAVPIHWPPHKSVPTTTTIKARDRTPPHSPLTPTSCRLSLFRHSRLDSLSIRTGTQSLWDCCAQCFLVPSIQDSGEYAGIQPGSAKLMPFSYAGLVYIFLTDFLTYIVLSRPTVLFPSRVSRVNLRFRRAERKRERGGQRLSRIYL